MRREAETDGCIHEPQPRHAGYDPAYFERLAIIEGEHFWFASRRDLILALAQSFGPQLPTDARILEIGCGTGNILSALEQACPSASVFGMDKFQEGLSVARGRGRGRLLQGDAYQAPFASEFDIVGAFDVIEHLPDDERILRALHGMVRTGGQLMITVPAYQWLWSDFDVASHHCRRYSKPELERKLQAAGFTDVFVSPFMMSILPLVWLHRKAWRPRRDGDGHGIIGEEIRIIPSLNAVLRFVLSCENQLVRRNVPLPFGSSMIAVARK